MSLTLVCDSSESGERDTALLREGTRPSEGIAVRSSLGDHAPISIECEPTFESLDEMAPPLTVDWRAHASAARMSVVDIQIEIAIEPR